MRVDEIASSFLLAKTRRGDALAQVTCEAGFLLAMTEAVEIFEAIESPNLDDARARLEELRDRAD